MTMTGPGSINDRLAAWEASQQSGDAENVATLVRPVVEKVIRDAVTRDYHQMMTARWYLIGVTIPEIAERNGITVSAVYSDLKVIRNAWRKSAVTDFSTLVNQQLTRLDHIEERNWRAWEASQEEHQRVKKESRQSANGTLVTHQVISEQSHGDSTYMQTIRWCVEERSKLLGLYAAVKVNATVSEGKPYDPDADQNRIATLLNRFLETGSVDEPDRIIEGSATEHLSLPAE